MKYTIEQLSYIVPAISIGFLLIITSINVYFKIRRLFPVTVNCWFCNENSRVSYDDFNKWTCSRCEQYNGFLANGDYNCDIPAQRSAKLNKWKTSSFSSMNGSICGNRITPTNGLCEPCNRNQELKVQQLASFEPENDAYFNEEIEEYRYKLEQAYRLCPRCERHLKRTLNKVKTNILGSKLKQIGAKGLQAFDLNLNQKFNKDIVYRKRLTFARISLGALIIISMLQSFNVTNQMNITKSKLDLVFNAETTTKILTILSYMSAMKILTLQLIQYIFELPYISYAVASAQLLVKYVYTYVSGDFWKLINAAIIEMVKSGVTETENVNPGYSTVTTNVSGCFLSVFLLFLFGLGWGPVVSLLLWSFGMIMPIFIQNTTDVRQALVLDFIQLILVWSSATLSIANFFILPNKQIPLNNDKNSSFHRLNSEMNPDVSDDSEVESELDLSLRSNLSSASKRSMWNETKVLNSTIASKAPSMYSTNSLRQRSYCISNQSLASTKPASDMNASFGLDRSFYRASQLDLTRDKLNKSQKSFLTAKTPEIFNRSHCPSVMSLNSLNRTFTNAMEPSFRSSSRNSFYDVPNDFDSGITRLNIGGIDAKKSSHVFGSSNVFNDSLSNRGPILSPSRLSLNESQHSVNQSSWLAGGYWNSTSPQKKSAQHTREYKMEERNISKEMFPMMSRASSKSSGFESRENSLCDDTEMDRTFLFSEPASLTQAAKTTNGLIKPQPQKPINNLFNGMITDNRYQQPTLFTAAAATATPTPNLTFGNSAGKNASNFSLSRSFSQFSLQQQQQQLPSSHFQNHNNSFDSNQSIASDVNKFASTNHEQPMRTFQRGSLIKLHENTSMDH